MSGSLSRSVSLSPLDPSPPSQPVSGSPPKLTGLPKDTRQLADLTISPLKIFVSAKKRINDVFVGIQGYVEESHAFLAALNSGMEAFKAEDCSEVEKFKVKITGIRDVLSRDHMKVVFFGRTSNGKSTVINSMLQDKILPSGLGHTTNCFLQVEGSDSSEAYLLTEDSSEPKNVESVLQLANALNSESLGESALVRIFWPKDRCNLLRDDVVLVDSPGIDVSPNLDLWIDKHCLDADVFVLVANAESTLMVTEKNFFHKVSERLSKPNIFILNNRWDASASEPEIIEKVRKQHLERNLAFLVDELKVANRQQAEDRVFFVSAREVLNARLRKQQGLPQHSGVGLAEGFQGRYFEFQDFERKFEECLSKSAVKTKFEQHTQRGEKITSELRAIMDKVYEQASLLKTEKQTLRREQWERLQFTQQQLQLLTEEAKQRIGQLVEQVEQQVAGALSEEIRRLELLVGEFERPFHPDPLVLGVYKRELHAYVERGLGCNLRARLSTTLQMSVENAQKEMTGRMSSLIPSEQQPQMLNVLPRHNFEVLYRINCESLCCDFQEDLQFRFSFGLANMIKFFTQHRKVDPTTGVSYSNTIPRPQLSTPQTPSNEIKVFPAAPPDYLGIVHKLAVVSPTPQTALGVLTVGGCMVRAIGWKVIAVALGTYGALYLFERLTWTNRSKERCFKRQYVQHATRKLRLIVDLTSANCSHQVQQELSSTFARLGHVVDEVVNDMDADIKKLDKEIAKMEEATTNARTLRNKAGYLMSELETFSQQYLQYDQ
ncbi:mitochondrial assembly regulatory factor [Dermacentor variabilis]|uniref:mitochondrial assembly regulatory factor n=1 Tax=Dermacentor variabilis TaxID=34621 RepID=UPI003F5CBAEF